ncbi:DUF6234 family protein [Streptomyces californicus]|uniref:DUF6234 family protein n=1 Tax=Streptomyces californicus TaxID=67351 RepID=UPI00378F1FDA
MTDPVGRLPGRPGERSAAERPSGGADLLTGVLLVVADATAGALLTLWLVVRGMTRSHEAAEGKATVPPPADPAPGTDWTPIVVIAAFVLVVACVAVGLLRGGWYWSGGMQAVVAVALGVALLASAVQGGGREAEEPAPAWNAPPCLSGGDSDECARSGG